MLFNALLTVRSSQHKLAPSAELVPVLLPFGRFSIWLLSEAPPPKKKTLAYGQEGGVSDS